MRGFSFATGADRGQKLFFAAACATGHLGLPHQRLCDNVLSTSLDLRVASKGHRQQQEFTANINPNIQ